MIVIVRLARRPGFNRLILFKSITIVHTSIIMTVGTIVIVWIHLIIMEVLTVVEIGYTYKIQF